jgi:hypothetical protein
VTGFEHDDSVQRDDVDFLGGCRRPRRRLLGRRRRGGDQRFLGRSPRRDGHGEGVCTQVSPTYGSYLDAHRASQYFNCGSDSKNIIGDLNGSYWISCCTR